MKKLYKDFLLIGLIIMIAFILIMVLVTLNDNNTRTYQNQNLILDTITKNEVEIEKEQDLPFAFFLRSVLDSLNESKLNSPYEITPASKVISKEYGRGVVLNIKRSMDPGTYKDGTNMGQLPDWWLRVKFNKKDKKGKTIIINYMSNGTTYYANDKKELIVDSLRIIPY